ncbi:MAG: class I SAM-dependent methyltransferase [Candidatus Sungbacteria bacterium]|nr:class I SAM-dependent methyltransferase [Candidatus Sungbacteria bacterium]
MDFSVHTYSAYSPEDAQASRGYRFADTGIPLQQYDGEFDFFINLVAGIGGPVFELAAGSGRIMEILATAEVLNETGVHIYGLEASESMLFRAQRAFSRLSAEERQRLHLIKGDMCRFALRQVFSLVIVPFNSFWYNFWRYEDGLLAASPRLAVSSSKFVWAAAEQCLSCILNVLCEGGTFVIDMPVIGAPSMSDQHIREWWESMGAKYGFEHVFKQPYSRSDVLVDVLVARKKI